MRYVLAVISGSLLLAQALLAQKGNAGIDIWTTKELIGASEMGRSTLGTEGPSLLTFEKNDDPTVAPHPVPLHEPLRAALKVADEAEHLAKKKRHEEAIARYRQAVAIDPLYFQAWNNLGLELKTAGKADEAEQVMRRLMQSNPEHVLVFANLTGLLSDEKRYADAEAVARQGVKRHSYSFIANFVLGTLLINQGKWSDEAKTKLEYAQVKYPEAKRLLEHWPDKPALN
jgi:tetratricopeptide (TPR) repeat protein